MKKSICVIVLTCGFVDCFVVQVLDLNLVDLPGITKVAIGDIYFILLHTQRCISVCVVMSCLCMRDVFWMWRYSMNLCKQRFWLTTHQLFHCFRACDSCCLVIICFRKVINQMTSSIVYGTWSWVTFRMKMQLSSPFHQLNSSYCLLLFRYSLSFLIIIFIYLFNLFLFIYLIYFYLFIFIYLFNLFI